MAPGPPNLGTNRFAALSPPSKKKRNIAGFQFEFPELPKAEIENPRYIVLSALENDKTMSSYSCFSVHKSLLAIDKGILAITPLRDGNLLILVKNQNTADKFLKRTELPGICKIKCKLHDALNSSKGTLYAPYLNDIPEEDIIKELSSQKVVGVHKFKRMVDGVARPSGVVLFTFDLYTLPSKIDISWYSAKIRPYFPNPMRCKSCQRLGHTDKHCKNTAVCATCSLPPHLPERACTQIKCTNCQGEHEASFRDCPKYVEAKEILKIKTEKKCSMYEARNFYKTTTTTNGTSYAAITSTNNKINNKTNNTNLTQKTKNNDDIPSHSRNINTNNTTSYSQNISTIKINNSPINTITAQTTQTKPLVISNESTPALKTTLNHSETTDNEITLY